MIVAALRLAGLQKAFGASVAVAGLDITIASGEFYALLGPNGAGKTTTLRMIAGLCDADEGSIEVFGVDARADPMAAKRIVAWLSDEPLLYDALDPLEYLEFVAGLWSIPPAVARARAEDLLRTLDLWDKRGVRCEAFSRGMKQKVALAGALIHDPRLLILDEPLTGLDAASARVVKDLLRARTRAGHAVLLTTHILEVAERLADRIGIIDQGRLVAEGTCADILRDRRAANLEDAFLDLTRDRPAA